MAIVSFAFYKHWYVEFLLRFESLSGRHLIFLTINLLIPSRPPAAGACYILLFAKKVTFMCLKLKLKIKNQKDFKDINMYSAAI